MTALPLTLKEAFTIVIDLAQENVLTDEIADQDPEVLEPEQAEQQEAVDMVIAQVRAMDEAGMFDK